MAHLSRPPGPKSRGFIGNFPLASKDPLAVFTQWSRDYGNIYYYRNLNRHVYTLNHPDLIRQVLLTEYQNFIKGQAIQFSRPVFGNGLFTNEGDPWLRQRRLIQPAFHRDRVSGYGSIVVANTENMLSEWRNGEERDIHDEMMRLALHVVSKALFDLENDATTARISAALNTILRLSSGARLLMPPILRKVPTPNNLRYRRALRELDDIVYGLLRERRKGDGEGTDLLSVLLHVRDEDGQGMSDHQLRDEVMTLLVAGHETTAISLSWAWYLLSKHPAVEEQLWSELEQVLGGRAPTVRDIPDLPFTERVVKEAMRLFPPAWALDREVLHECEIGGFKVPPRSTVLMSQWVTHRDPRFFDHPEEFQPDRWLEERTKALPKFAYFPFGGGPRVCIGASFAMMEAVLVVATIAQRFQIRVTADSSLRPIPTITLRPNQPIRGLLVQRQPSAMVH